MQPSLSIFQNWYKDHFEEIKKDFFTFLSFPSISTDPRYKDETRKTALWLSSYLTKIGMKSEIWETTGHPVVFASLITTPDKPTVLIYQHYDVQPVDPLDLWKSHPFQPEVRDNQVFARGAVDNKGQCFYSIQALRAFIELAKQGQINIKVFIEGEEESGGKGTVALLPQKKEELKADHLLVVDFDLPEPGVPGVTLGMRGMVAMNVECSNSRIDLHSGTHGGIALNPNRALITLLSKLWDSSGKVAIPGFYDDVKEISKEEVSRLNPSFDMEKYKSDFGVKAFCAEKGRTLMESNWLRPTLEINGISGGYTGEGFKTVIPSKATAKISSRLVPNQDPDKIGKSIADFLKTNAPEGIDLRVELHHGAPAYRSSFDSDIVKTAAKAFEEVFEKPCQFLLCGASVPIVADLAKVTGAEAALIGVGLSSDDIHAPNEHFGLDRFEKGFLAMARILSMLSS